MSLSTHVLDTARGRPAAGIAVRLEQGTGDGWREVARGETDADGRIGGWCPGAGVHRLVFDVADLHEGFFPEVTVVFRIADAEQHHHVPLLISPFGYTTYRGS
ncbi:hydroxyisourate hydrolase [Gandjariella thermophila]|uniref:5-hydroxyisourate hydrolase n=1 Tax=Gandjariella thermophila TaxID=1931992 RepID=A0A4D4J2T7_9PSEU|nr:hydroxyisourate hydrolase [Gandjariella thermophila]GDY29734.1 5-hydroxyisourate hydrolase [Gandjariella thermophila]